MSTLDSSGAPRRSNVTLWLILAVCLAPLIASYALYSLWRPARLVNYGDLIDPPILLSEVSLPRHDGEAFRFGDLKGKWILLTVDSGRCDEACLRKLYHMRQLRLAQGKDQDRIERLWLIHDEQPVADDVARAFAGTIQVRLQDAQFLQRLPAPHGVARHIYMVDPLGNLMMRFPSDADPNKVKKDLAKVLKLSSGWVQVK